MTRVVTDHANAVIEAIESRRSVRGFLPRDIPRERIERLLAAASRAPSGSNVQPWRVHVLTGAAKARLTAAILRARETEAAEPSPEYRYYPDRWQEPHLGRRREQGWALYKLLGIEKGDHNAARTWQDRNFDFFGAPVGMIFTLERKLELGMLADCGMFIEALMIAAQSLGLATCAQAAFAGYYATIRETLSITDDELIVCGLALGYEDPSAPANRLRNTRAPIGEFVVFHSD